MKKFFFSSLLLVGLMGVSNADTYTCYRYKNGKPIGGFVKVKANSKYEAEEKAMEKYRKMHDGLFGGFKANYVNCKK